MYISGNRIKIKKYFKVNYLFFILSVIVLLKQSIDLFLEYMSGKTVINISIENIRNSSLPSITLCPSSLDFSKLSLLNENISKLYEKYLKMIENEKIKGKSVERDESIDLTFKSIEIYLNSRRNNIEMKDILDNLASLINRMNESILSSVFFQSSAYGDIDKDLNKYDDEYYTNHIMKSLPMESFRMYINEKYPFIIKCYTLFSHLESSWDQEQMVFRIFIIRIKLDIFSQFLNKSTFMIIIMHSPNTMAFRGFSNFNPGYNYMIKYSKWNIIRLGKGYDTDCREYDPKKYTRNDCIFDCYQKTAKKICGTNNFVSCPMFRKKIYFEQSNLNFSKCNLKMKFIDEQLEFCKGQCKKECTITYYSYTIDKLNEIDLYHAGFVFKPNEMPDQTIRHIPEMPFLIFICNFGGILGMWLGVSFVDILNISWNLLRSKILSFLTKIFIFKNNICYLFVSMKIERKRTKTRVVTLKNICK